MSAGSCTSRASIVNTDHWLSLVLDMRTGPGVALALESLVETNLQTCCPPVALASAPRSAKPWPGEMGPPKPGGHPREDRGRPCTPGPVSEAQGGRAGSQLGPAAGSRRRRRRPDFAPSRRVYWLPEETRPPAPGVAALLSLVWVPAHRGDSGVMSRGGASGPRRLDPTSDAALGTSSPALEVRSQPAGRAQRWPRPRSRAASPTAGRAPGVEVPGAQTLRLVCVGRSDPRVPALEVDWGCLRPLHFRK